MTDEPRRFRFLRHMRLLNARDYQRVFREPQRSSGRALTVLARPSGLAWPRLGLAISRKQIKRATQRNRIKRLVRESFRHHQALLNGLDVVVIARSESAVRESRSLSRCLALHWQRVREQCMPDC